LAHASVTTALVNVRVNINLIKDDEEARALTEEANDIEARSAEAIAECRSLLHERRSA
jgi:formiminotetrahydrofolate cyclodeaminase